jgi:hypothetical protein
MRNARFPVLTAVLLKIEVFWDVRPCRLVNNTIYKYSIRRCLIIVSTKLMLLVTYFTLMGTWQVDGPLNPLIIHVNYCSHLYTEWSQDSAVDVVARLHVGQQKNRGSIPDRVKWVFSYPKHRRLLWDPPNFLFVECRTISMGWIGRCVKLTSPFLLVLKLRINGSIPPILIWLQGVHRDIF